MIVPFSQKIIFGHVMGDIIVWKKIQSFSDTLHIAAHWAILSFTILFSILGKTNTVFFGIDCIIAGCIFYIAAVALPIFSVFKIQINTFTHIGHLL